MLIVSILIPYFGLHWNASKVSYIPHAGTPAVKAIALLATVCVIAVWLRGFIESFDVTANVHRLWTLPWHYPS